LSEKHGGNVHDRQIVNITPSRANIASGGRPLGSLMARNEICQMDGSDQWICYDFKQMRVTMTHYTIRGVHSGSLKNWTIEGWQGKSWEELDRRMNDPHLEGQHTGIGKIATYQAATVREVQMIRITQVGRNHSNSLAFWITGLEFFGYIRE
jgi:hypothetical protein